MNGAVTLTPSVCSHSICVTSMNGFTTAIPAFATIPVKAALAMVGIIEEVYRLPMVPMTSGNRARLEQILIELGVISSGSPRV